MNLVPKIFASGVAFGVIGVIAMFAQVLLPKPDVMDGVLMVGLLVNSLGLIWTAQSRDR